MLFISFPESFSFTSSQGLFQIWCKILAIMWIYGLFARCVWTARLSPLVVIYILFLVYSEHLSFMISQWHSFYLSFHPSSSVSSTSILCFLLQLVFLYTLPWAWISACLRRSLSLHFCVSWKNIKAHSELFLFDFFTSQSLHDTFWKDCMCCKICIAGATYSSLSSP